MIGIYSSGIWRIPHLINFLRQPCRKLRAGSRLPATVRKVAVWGYRPSGEKYARRAEALGRKVMRLEDGFIRSLGLGVEGAPPFSMVIDNLGMYYDAERPSTLEQLIQDRAGNAALEAEARGAMHAIVSGDLSKYNQAPPFKTRILMPSEVVLVVDQTAGDMALKWGGIEPTDFTRMLNAALTENPQAQIWIKVHPDVLSGKKQGCSGTVRVGGRVHLFAEDVSPYSLLRHVSKVYVMTSQLGFEALMAGKPVVCFGLPWYAGWGLTDDRHFGARTLAARRGNASLIELFSAAYLRYSRYIHPLSGQPARLAEVLEWLIRQRQHNQQRAGHLWVPGVSLWKASIIKPFLRTQDNRVTFSRRNVSPDACVVWGVKGELRWGWLAQQRGLPVWRMEDGFLRSSGLGSDLHQPLSLVLDKQGIYYDARRPSDLEEMLNNSVLTECQQQRAQRLHQMLVQQRVSKYNVGQDFQLPPQAAGKTVILVPGQVEDDASIATGTLSVRTNLDLLTQVRERNPQAFIIFKPHPDVLVGNRQGHIPPQAVARLADLEVRDADIIQCIMQVDELHTMTSLSGFEALLHGKRVHCYGLPFYAGWGLTETEFPCERRTRRLALVDLIYQTLIAYPTYLHPHTSALIDAEEAVALLVEMPRSRLVASRNNQGRIGRYCRKLKMFLNVRFL